MSSKSNQGFTTRQIQILLDWIRSQDQPFDNLNLPVISQQEIDTESILLSLGPRKLFERSLWTAGWRRQDSTSRYFSYIASMGFDQ